MIKEKERYFSNYNFDFEQTKNQNYKLPENYKWVNTGIFSKSVSSVLYFLAVGFGVIYCKLFLHVKIIGKEKLKKEKNGFFIYGNHTQPVGDVFIPALCTFPKRIYTLASPANFGITFIGKILNLLGAIPVSNTVNEIKQLNKTINYRINQKNAIVIYPEAHVWKYYTKIRPFSSASFKFPVKLLKPSYSLTVTYKKQKFFKKPKTEVFIDGPFYPKGTGVKEKSEFLCKKITSVMKERSLNSNTEYIKYIYLN